MDPLEAKRRLRIRQATTVDCVAIVEMLAKAGHEFDATLALRPLAGSHCDQDFVISSADQLATGMLHEGQTWWIATDSDQLVGVSHACPADDDNAPCALKLAVFFLLEQLQDCAVADALLHTTIGNAPCYLWVSEHDEAAQAFYRRNNFTPAPICRENLARWPDRQLLRTEI